MSSIQIFSEVPFDGDHPVAHRRLPGNNEPIARPCFMFCLAKEFDPGALTIVTDKGTMTYTWNRKAVIPLCLVAFACVKVSRYIWDAAYRLNQHDCVRVAKRFPPVPSNNRFNAPHLPLMMAARAKLLEEITAFGADKLEHITVIGLNAPVPSAIPGV